MDVGWGGGGMVGLSARAGAGLELCRRERREGEREGEEVRAN